MDVVRYSKDNPWVMQVECPNCKSKILAWLSSGMSASFPHFYCDRCSNVIVRESDKIWISNGVNLKTVLEIENTLPNCDCGGKFKSDTNPKCPTCNFEFKHKNNSIDRLTDPHIILLNGAGLFDDKGLVYHIEIE